MSKRFIRIIPKLDIKNGLLIKGINLEGLRVLGNPNDYIKYYYNSGADEIIYLDNIATLYGVPILNDDIKKAVSKNFIPFVVGGGINKLDDIERVLKSGADKVCINSFFVNNPKFISKACKMFGSSTITVLIESNKVGKKYYITTSNGRDLVDKNPIEWAKECEQNGVGEVLLTSVNKEGLQKGFDISITKKVSNKLSIPVIAHGGAGSFLDIYKVISKTSISGVSLSSILHYDAVSKLGKKTRIGNLDYINNLPNKIRAKNYLKKLKIYLKQKGINVRI
ncbi:imidazole glycerol phosphate synthase cyclase subunit [Pelagibacterales bacterium SAG-MED23]|nr:imidazole glycerol phosphate synthase cyclase subunit [Pelagibacterales bacterium SAG-MED23]